MPLAALTRELAEEIAREFPGLQRLNLSRNMLRELEHLQLLPHLAQLDLSHNALRVLPADLGAWLPRLSRLNLRGNAIESLAGLAGCAQLASLDAGDNRVALLSELRFLAPLGRLRELALDGNPLETRLADAFRREALAMLPLLRLLDGRCVSLALTLAAERIQARGGQERQVRSALTAAEPDRGGAAAVERHGPGRRREERADAPVSRLLTPASVHQGCFRPADDGQELALSLADGDGGGDSDDSDDSDEEEEEVEEEVEEATVAPTSAPAASESTGRLWPVPIARRGQGEADDGGPARHDAAAPPRRDAQLQVALGGAACARTHTRSPSLRRRPAEPEAEAHALLQSRVEALERILALQDRALQTEMARAASSGDGGGGGGGGDGAKPRAVRLYVQVLGLWREKVVALMVQLQSAELARGARDCELRAWLAQLETARAQLAAQRDEWQQRVKDVEAQRDLERARAAAAEQRGRAASSQTAAAVRSMAAERAQLRRAAELVAEFAATDGLVDDKLRALAGELQRVGALARRLERARERLGTAALLVAHREARMRNTEAAMEAERRVLAHRVLKLSAGGRQAADRGSSDARAGAKAGADAHAASSAAARRLGQHRKFLRPATEAALRALFHRLDAYETGLVRASALLAALGRDEGVARAAGGREAADALAAHVARALERSRRGSALSAAAAPAIGGDKITWGEFLLLVLPDAPLASALGGGGGGEDDGEDDGAGRPGELADAFALPCELCASVRLEHGGEIPVCDVSGGEAAAAAAAQRRPSAGDRAPPPPPPQERRSRRELAAELAELRADREALRRRVLADAHGLQARAAEIRDEWRRKTERLASENADLREALEASRVAAAARSEACEQAERAAAEARHALENLRREAAVREQDATRERQALERQHQESVAREQDVWRRELQDAGASHAALQAELAKQQLRARQLERELASVRERAAEREAEQLARLEGRVAKRDGEIAKLRRERNALLSTLRDQERKLQTLSAAAPVETAATQTDAVEAVGGAAARAPAETAVTQTLEARDGGDGSGGDGNGEKRAAAAAAAASASHSAPSAGARLAPEDVARRLERLQLLTASLLGDD